MKSTKIVSFSALKGGTGKTIITFNIAALLAKEYKKKILVIDLDPQHNMTNILYGGVIRKIATLPDDHPLNKGTIYTSEDIFQREISAMGVIQSSHIKNIDVITTTIGMTATELQLGGVAGRELILKNWLFDNIDYLTDYDYIFFDTNPTMSTVNTNAYIVCDDIVLISDVDADGIHAVNTFLELYYPIQKRLDRQMEDNVRGLIINKIEEGKNLDKDFVKLINSEAFEHSDILIKTQIHDAVAIAETKATRDHVDKRRNARAFQEFINVIEELTERGIL